MLNPAEIQKRAARRYAAMLKLWPDFAGNFPIRIPLGAIKGPDLAGINQQIEALKSGSDEIRQSGYTLEYAERNSRTYGKNRFPTHACFHTADHLATFLGKTREWIAWCRILSETSKQFPAALRWLRQNPSLALPLASRWDQVMQVLHWRAKNPEIECYLREIPALPDSKFIEDQPALIAGLLECVVPQTVRLQFRGIERRFGFKKAEHFFVCRLLDQALQPALGWPFREIGLHPQDLIALKSTAIKRVIMVENRVNLHTLPDLPATLAIHGSGAAVSRLSQADWLRSVELIYWGDIDEHGFEILSRLRQNYPHTTSFLMNGTTVRRFRDLASPVNPSQTRPEKLSLSVEEMTAYRWCRRFRRRIEQERIPNEAVETELRL